jgi:hypothetical protein
LETQMNADPTPIAADRSIDRIRVAAKGGAKFPSPLSAAIGVGSAFIGAFKAFP